MVSAIYFSMTRELPITRAQQWTDTQRVCTRTLMHIQEVCPLICHTLRDSTMQALGYRVTIVLHTPQHHPWLE